MKGKNTHRTRYRGSPRGRSHAARWRRTCRRKGHAWGRWGLITDYVSVLVLESDLETEIERGWMDGWMLELGARVSFEDRVACKCVRIPLVGD